MSEEGFCRMDPIKIHMRGVFEEIPLIDTKIHGLVSITAPPKTKTQIIMKIAIAGTGYVGLIIECGAARSTS